MFWLNRVGYEALLCLAICFALPTGPEVYAQKPSTDVRVVSFNIRYGTAADGENHWDRRRSFLIETIQSLMPDLLGTQETLSFQRDFLADKLSGVKKGKKGQAQQ